MGGQVNGYYRKGIGKADGTGLGDGFSVCEMHPLIKVQGVSVADMGDENHEAGQEQDEEE